MDIEQRIMKTDNQAYISTNTIQTELNDVAMEMRGSIKDNKDAIQYNRYSIDRLNMQTQYLSDALMRLDNEYYEKCQKLKVLAIVELCLIFTELCLICTKVL